MSELEEKRFLESLKRLIREDQIVIVSSVRHETARYADYAVLCEKGRGLRVLESRQQFDSTVLSDHNHL